MLTLIMESKLGNKNNLNYYQKDKVKCQDVEEKEALEYCRWQGKLLDPFLGTTEVQNELLTEPH